MKFYPLKENWPIVSRLRERGYYTGVISNHARPWVERLRKVDDFENYFDHLTFSCDEDVKIGKPNPKIYFRALEKAQKVPWECLFIDDQNKNVIGARNAGMYAIQYTYGRDSLEALLRENGIKI